jgi:hypothetical protein
MPSLDFRPLIRAIAPCLLVALVVPCLALAQSEPRRGGPPVTPESPVVTGAKTPAVPAVTAPVTPLVPRRLPPVSPLDRGSVVTDPGLGGSAGPPNAIERAKLDLARQAVEMSRAAGTLTLAPPETAPTPFEIQRARELKLQMMLTRPPAVLPDDPAAGVLRSHTPRQLTGDGALTDAERAKLDAVLRGLTPPAAPVPAARDAAARPQDRKEDR